jgi:hypothetical protein
MEYSSGDYKMNELENLNTEGLARVAFEDYNDRRAYGKEDHDEALFNSINWVCRDKSEEFKSDLYARMATIFPTDQNIRMFIVTFEKEYKNA